MKFETAAQMIVFAAESMESIRHDPNVRSPGIMIRMISAASGLGRSTVEKFYHKRQTNLTISSIDKLLMGIRKVKRELAE